MECEYSQPDSNSSGQVIDCRVSRLIATSSFERPAAPPRLPRFFWRRLRTGPASCSQHSAGKIRSFPPFAVSSSILAMTPSSSMIALPSTCTQPLETEQHQPQIRCICAPEERADPPGQDTQPRLLEECALHPSCVRALDTMHPD